MGYGEVGSNGSVHWKIGYDDGANAPADHSDYDTRKWEEIGKGKDHDGSFRVTARFKTPKAAQDALTAAQQQLKATGGSVVVLDVGKRPKKTEAGPTYLWELRIDW